MNPHILHRELPLKHLAPLELYLNPKVVPDVTHHHSFVLGDVLAPHISYQLHQLFVFFEKEVPESGLVEFSLGGSVDLADVFEKDAVAKGFNDVFGLRGESCGQEELAIFLEVGEGEGAVVEDGFVEELGVEWEVEGEGLGLRVGRDDGLFHVDHITFLVLVLSDQKLALVDSYRLHRL